MAHKFETLGALSTDKPKELVKRVSNLEKKSAKDVAGLYGFEIRQASGKFD